MSNEPEIVMELREKEKQGLFKNGYQKVFDESEKSNSLLQRAREKDVFLRSNLLTSLLRNIPDSIYFKDREGRFVEVSQAKTEHLGTDRKSVVGKTDFDFYSEKEAQKMRKDEIYVMENEEVITVEERVTRPNGEKTWVSVVKAPRYDEDENVVGIIGISRDITERKKAELELHESEEKYRTIFENSAVAIMMTNEKEQIISWNSYTEKLLGVGEKELLKKPVKELYPEGEWLKIREKNIRKKGMQHHLETKMLKKNGETADVDISLSVLKNKNGTITGSIGVIRDITSRKKMEENLKIKDSAIYSSINAIAITDLKGNITYVNPSFLKLWGYKNKENLIGEPIVNFWQMKGKFVEVIDAVLNKDGWVGELKAERENTSIFDLQLSATSIKNSQNQPICMMASFVDITRRKWAEKKLHELNQDLEDKVKERTKEIENLLKQKDEFISQLGHDLKTPLTPLNSLLPILRKKETDEQVIKYLDLMIRNARYMKNLVEKTLKLALFSSTSFNLDIKDINVFNVLYGVIQNMGDSFEKNNIKVVNLVDKNVVIKTDQLRLEELFNNVISNAVKYSPDGGKITIFAEKEKNKIKFSVKDTGQGMTKEQSDKIFDEFYKADESRHDFNSSGLGLSICKRIVEKHGGRIWVESSGLGKGSTVYFTLKLAKGEEKK